MAVQLRNELRSGLALDRVLPATVMFDYPTIDSLSSYLAAVLFPESRPTEPIVIREDAPALIDSLIVADMSDSEVERLLLEKLERY
jgi:hypothetical protein